MTQDERCIFGHTPTDTGGKEERSRAVPEAIRIWLFSRIGLVCAWLLALGLLLPLTGFIALTLHEDYVLLILGFGMWLVSGLIVIHSWIPSTREPNTRTEGIAAAGWHVALTVAATGFVGWQAVFPDGLASSYTLADIRPVLVAGGTFTALFGSLLIWLRGHTFGRTIRYELIAISFASVWMSLWLVAAHGGLY